jgi:circadian clock protein KaiC
MSTKRYTLKKPSLPSPDARKVPTGIAGFDEITCGGLPRNRNTVLLGGPGSGKTLFALQTLVNGALRGEPGIFVAFEENTRQIVSNAASFGWDLPELERKKLFLLDAQPRAEHIAGGDFDLVGLLAGIAAKAHEMGARRIVFDSIDMLLSALDSIPKERREIHRLIEWLNDSGMTGLITSKLEESAGHASHRYGFMQYMADCAVRLNQQTVDRISQRELQVLKYRGSAFSENAAPMVIGARGIEVAHISATERSFTVTNRRISTGVRQLDTMLGGGYFQGSSVLITGAPGTAKSTLSGAFVKAACRHGGRALFVSFDEIGGEHVRNLASVGIDLAPHVASGRLKIYTARTEASSLEQHLVRIHTLIREHRARFVVFDPLSALFRSGAQSSVNSAAERLLHMTKAEGITTICTSLLASADMRVEGTPLEVSTIADTWIHLSYAVQAGERNRALTIVKSRGMSHSNQVRELLLADEGVSLADVYTANGEVLMGAMRWQREMMEQTDQENLRAQLEHKRHEVQLAESELNARIDVLRREVALKRFELDALARTESERRASMGRFKVELRRQRSKGSAAGQSRKNAGR